MAPSYSGGADVTFDLDLTWLGSGAMTRTGGVFRDGGTISFQWSRSRAATTFGRLDVDGAAATVTSASLVREASGTITF